MIKKTVKRKGQTYTLLWEGYDRDTKLCLDGVFAEKVYFHPKNNIFYAPFETKDGAYWMFVYNQKIHFTKAIHGTTEEDFERDVVGHAYSLPTAILYLIFALFVPIAVAASFSVIFTPEQSTSIFIILIACGSIDFWLFNVSPIASKRVRKKLCLFSLVAVVLCWIIFLLNYLTF